MLSQPCEVTQSRIRRPSPLMLVLGHAAKRREQSQKEHLASVHTEQLLISDPQVSLFYKASLL